VRLPGPKPGQINAEGPGSSRGLLHSLALTLRRQGAAPEARSWGMALMAIPQATTYFLPIAGINDVDDPR